MTTQQIRYAIEIYRTGSISKAAANLFIAQPNLSNSIKAMEVELGYDIFVRSNRGVVPTQQGEQFLLYAGEMWGGYQRMLEIPGASAVPRARIGGLAYEPTRTAYTKLCLEYQDCPQLDFSFDYVTSRSALDRLVLADLDVAVVYLQPSDNTVQMEEFSLLARKVGVRCELLQSPRLVLLIGPNHPLYRQEKVEISDFDDSIFVDYTVDYASRRDLVQQYLSLDPRHVITTQTEYSKHELVLRGSRYYAADCELPKKVYRKLGYRAIPVADVRYRMMVLTREKEKLLPPVQRYLELLKEELDDIEE